MKAKNLPMNPGIKNQRIYVREKRIEKIAAQTFTLLFVEIPSFCQIIEAGLKDAKIHFPPLRNFDLACSQSNIFSSPLATRFAVSRKASACQAGDSIASSSRLKSAHNASMSRNFSRRGIC